MTPLGQVFTLECVQLLESYLCGGKVLPVSLSRMLTQEVWPLDVLAFLAGGWPSSGEESLLVDCCGSLLLLLGVVG